MAGYGDERLRAELTCRVRAAETPDGTDPEQEESPRFDEVRLAFELVLAPTEALLAAIEAANRSG